MGRRDALRRGFSLIELLVVITMLAFLAAMTALFFPRFQERHQVETASSNLSSWLLTAKMMARRDGLPTGLRYLGVSSTTTGGAAQFQYIQQPDDFAQGVYLGPAVDSRGNPIPLTARFSNDAQTQQALSHVTVGDHLEIYGGGPPRLIKQILAAQQQLVLDPTSTPLPANTITPTNTSTTNYRIIPQPRVMNGEPPLSLPTDVIVDVSAFPAPNNTRFHSKLPASPTANTPFSDILFAPSGAVIGSGAANPGYYYYYLRDNGQDTQRKINPPQSKLFEGYPRLVAVYPRTGFIATHPVNPDPANHDLFLKDGRASGM
jgi:prepilin-type N-terminal cleavage/methylation domain-containing protein